MATRMQQRKGTAAQWAAADPILNAGEIGWESDTNKFKIGDGTNHWDDLTYFLDSTDTGFNSADYLLATSKNAVSGVAALNADINVITTTGVVFEGATANDFETTLAVTDPTEDRTITLPNVSGTVITTGNISDITSVGILTSSVVFEGTTANDFELTLAAGDPTADRTVSFPDAGGTLVVDSATQTLTNKTLTSPLVSNLQITDGSIVIEGSTPNDFETTITVTDPTADRTITIPDASGTIAFLDSPTFTGTVSLPNNTISQAMMGDDSVGTNEIGGFAVTTAKIADLNVTEGKLADGAITNAKVSASAAIAQSKIDGLTTDLGLKAPLAAPALTGDATAVNLTISGNLTVNGTTTNINSTNLVVEDKNVILGDVTTPTDTTADGGGITLKGATDKTLNWVDATDAWTSSEHINIASGKSYYANGTLLKDVEETLTNKTLTSPKINLGINAQTDTTYTFVLADNGKFVTASNASPITVTIPPISSVAYPVGAQLNIVQKGAGQVTFAQGAGVTINSTGATATAPKLRVRYSSATAVHEGSDIWYVVGDIA
jgi:hypothetical protein